MGTERRYSMRLIDADALDEKLETIKMRYKAQGRDSVADDYNFVQTVLQTAPTMEAEMAVHAEWEPHPTLPGFVRCSACRDCITYDEWPDGKKWKRCPECGAHMDKVAGHG